MTTPRPPTRRRPHPGGLTSRLLRPAWSQRCPRIPRGIYAVFLTFLRNATVATVPCWSCSPAHVATAPPGYPPQLRIPSHGRPQTPDRTLEQVLPPDTRRHCEAGRTRPPDAPGTPDRAALAALVRTSRSRTPSNDRRARDSDERTIP